MSNTMGKNTVGKDKTLFIGCLHLDSNYAIKYRPYAPQDKEGYNKFIIDRINEYAPDSSYKIFLMGDIADSKDGWKLLKQLNTNKLILIDGNHDSGLNPYTKLTYVNDIRGAMVMNPFLVTHIPVHPIELSYDEKLINVHAHSHYNSIPDPKYLNLSFDTYRRPITRTEVELFSAHNTKFFAENQRLPVVTFDDDHSFTIEGLDYPKK